MQQLGQRRFIPMDFTLFQPVSLALGRAYVSSVTVSQKFMMEPDVLM
jgi:hypothetical protein